MGDSAARWSLVVIHYRDQSAVVRLLAERDTWSASPHRTVVVDNSGDLELPAGLADIVCPGANLGYGAAANLGLQRLLADDPALGIVLVCTQDAALEPGAVRRMLDTMAAEPRAAVVGPLLAYASAPDVVFSAGGRLSRRGVGTHPAQGTPRADVRPGTVEVDWVDGAVTLLDVHAVLDVGGFDPRYFLYFEEIDLQTRLRIAGRTVVLDRDAIGYQEPGRYPTYLKYRNGLYLTRKLSPALARFPVGSQFLRDCARAVLRGRPFAPFWAWRGIIDAFRGRMGPPPATLRDQSPEIRLAPADDEVAVVIEFTRADLPSGVARRYDHVIDQLSAAGVRCRTVVLNDQPRRSLGVRRRLIRARLAPELLAGVSPTTPAVVIGLGTPTMAVAGRRLHAAGRRVVFDECDSVLQQLHERLPTRQLRLIAIGIWQLALHMSTPSAVAVSYISDRDARADRRIRGRRTILVLPPSAPEELRNLPSVRYPLARIVVPIELASHHTRAGFRMLLEAVRARPTATPIDVYGPTAPHESLPEGVTYRGWAERLIDIYDGDTAVLITNIGGTGVPNKLVEAADAHRPAVLHHSLVGRWPSTTEPRVFDDAATLSAALEAVVRGPGTVRRAVVVPDTVDAVLAFLGIEPSPVRGGDHAAP